MASWPHPGWPRPALAASRPHPGRLIVYRDRSAPFCTVAELYICFGLDSSRVLHLLQTILLFFWFFIKRNNYGKVAQPWSGKPYLLSFLPKHATSKLAKMKTLKVPDSVYSTMTSGHGTEEVRHCTKKTFAHNRKERKRERSVTRSIC